MTLIQRQTIICTVLLSGTVTTLVAKTHPIVVTIKSGVIQYGHNPHDGDKGNVLATSGDSVYWKCDRATCSSILIHFDVTSPCSEGNDISSSGNPATATCTVNDSSILQPFKYKITVNGSISDDPHVIVDNQVREPKKAKKPKTTS